MIQRSPAVVNGGAMRSAEIPDRELTLPIYYTTDRYADQFRRDGPSNAAHSINFLSSCSARVYMYPESLINFITSFLYLVRRIFRIGMQSSY